MVDGGNGGGGGGRNEALGGYLRRLRSLSRKMLAGWELGGLAWGARDYPDSTF